MPLRIERGKSSYYARLLSNGGLDDAVALAARFPGSLEALGGDRKPRLLRSPGQAAAALKRGESIRANSMQRFVRAIGLLARAIEQDLTFPVNVNLYLTPPSQQALARHFDTHDVFVLQTAGTKRWRLFDSNIDSPLEYLPLARGENMERMVRMRLDKRSHAGVRDASKLTDEFLLGPGDLLYLPRGFWHEAGTQAGEVSCHLTVGVQVYTYTDLACLAIGRAAIADARLRAALPAGFARNPEIAQHAARACAGMLGPAIPAEALAAGTRDLAAILTQSRPEIPRGILRAAQGLEPPGAPSDALRLRPSGVPVLIGDRDACELRYGNRGFSVPPHLVPACAQLIAGGSCPPGALDGSASPSEIAALSAQLVAEGIAEPVTPPDPGWLPSRFVEWRGELMIESIQAGPAELREPFLAMSIRRLQSRRRRREKPQSLLAPDLPPPRAFVFHISRCGSTLLANAIRDATGAVVASEAPVLNSAVASLLQSLPDSDRIRAAISAFARLAVNGQTSLFIKFSSWNLLALKRIRELWPFVPVWVVVRDPIEVMVSCLRSQPGWLRWRQNPRLAAGRLGFDPSGMTSEEYCARCLGQFIARAHSADTCSVLDYSELSPERVEGLLGQVDLPLTQTGQNLLAASFLNYSKDRSPARPFRPDAQGKREAATEAMRKACDYWTRPAYERILQERSPLQASGNAYAASTNL